MVSCSELGLSIRFSPLGAAESLLRNTESTLSGKLGLFHQQIDWRENLQQTIIFKLKSGRSCGSLGFNDVQYIYIYIQYILYIYITIYDDRIVREASKTELLSAMWQDLQLLTVILQSESEVQHPDC